jgi:hypothetical protein
LQNKLHNLFVSRNSRILILLLVTFAMDNDVMMRDTAQNKDTIITPNLENKKEYEIVPLEQLNAKLIQQGAEAVSLNLLSMN